MKLIFQLTLALLVVLSGMAVAAVLVSIELAIQFKRKGFQTRFRDLSTVHAA